MRLSLFLLAPKSSRNLPADGRRYLYAGDEIFVHFGPNHGAHAFNQNRVQGGIGYRLIRNNRIEIGYCISISCSRTAE